MRQLYKELSIKILISIAISIMLVISYLINDFNIKEFFINYSLIFIILLIVLIGIRADIKAIKHTSNYTN